MRVAFHAAARHGLHSDKIRDTTRSRSHSLLQNGKRRFCMGLESGNRRIAVPLQGDGDFEPRGDEAAGVQAREVVGEPPLNRRPYSGRHLAHNVLTGTLGHDPYPLGRNSPLHKATFKICIPGFHTRGVGSKETNLSGGTSSSPSEQHADLCTAISNNRSYACVSYTVRYWCASSVC